MAGKRGIAGAELLARRTREQRGGQEKHADSFDRTASDALAWWRDGYLDALRSRNYSEETAETRGFDLKMFLGWAAERDLSRAGQVTRPILEAYQRWLWRYEKPNGKRLGWSTQRAKLGTLKDFFRWLTRQNVILHNPACELELPRPEKRLPQQALSLAEIERLLSVPNVADPLGHSRPRHAGGVLLDGHAAGRTVPPGTGRPAHRAAHPPHPPGQGQEGPHGARGRSGPRIGWSVTCGRRARGSAWTPAPRRCSSPATAGRSTPTCSARMVTQWMEQAGLPKKGSCHLLRHTCATHMLEGGADIRYIQQLLGHEKLDTTAIYTEVSIKQLQEVHARCHPAARLPAADVASRPGPEAGP